MIKKNNKHLNFWRNFNQWVGRYYQTYTSCPEVFSIPSQFMINKYDLSLFEGQETTVFSLVVFDGLNSAYRTCAQGHTMQ